VGTAARLSCSTRTQQTTLRDGKLGAYWGELIMMDENVLTPGSWPSNMLLPDATKALHRACDGATSSKPLSACFEDQ
jgi:hypothetical protein